MSTNRDLIKRSAIITLSPEQNVMYEEIKAELEKGKLLIGDVHLLKMYVAMLDLFSKKLTLVQNGCDIQVYASGAQQVSPEYTIMRNAMEDVIRLSERLGLPTTVKMKLGIEVGTTNNTHELDDI